MDNLTQYSVQEDATPKNPSQFSGGYGQLTYTRLERLHEERTIQTVESLHDPDRGDVQGIVRTLNSSDGLTSVTADSALAFFNAWYTVPPFHGLLSNYVQMLMDICGVDLPLSVDSTLSSSEIFAPGFEGNVWDNFRQCAAVNEFEIAQVGERLVVRPWRKFESYYNQSTTESWTIDTSNTTELVVVNWYDMSWGTAREIPLQSLTDDSPLSVDAGATIIQSFTIDGSVQSVNQPVPMDYVSAGFDANGSSGAYCVSGNDGKPILADRWLAGGGSLTVRMTDDPSVIEVVLVGSKISDYAPYKIAATAGESSYYNSLHVTGTGFSWNKNEVTMHTGSPRSASANETTVTFDSKYVNSLAKAYNVALRMSQDLCGGLKTISGSSRSLNRPENRSGQIFGTFSDFNSWASSNSISTFSDFNSFWDGLFKDLLVNQSFGQAIGARAFRGDAWYRVESTTTDRALVQYTLKPDTLISDWNKFAQDNGIETFQDFNAWYNGLRFVDFNSSPLGESV